jgi:hypothetical protein
MQQDTQRFTWASYANESLQENIPGCKTRGKGWPSGVVYLDMLQQVLVPQSDEDDREGRIHFPRDSAPPPPHCLGEVREYLNPGGRIGTAAPVARPHCSPHFFLIRIH